MLTCFLGILAAQDTWQSLQLLFSSFYVVHYSEPDRITNRRCVVLTPFNMQLIQKFVKYFQMNVKKYRS